MIFNICKEICKHCLKNVGLGHPHFECSSCNSIFHARCFKACKAEVINENFYCVNCKHAIAKKFNPFKVMIGNVDETVDPYLQKMSDILEYCKPHTIKSANTEINPLLAENLSMLFQNIDGNRTNFDSFTTEIDRITGKFRVIGLAETNIGHDESPVYYLEGYNSFYQEKHVNKSKGTGVAIYLDVNLNGVVNDQLSWITKNLETLFVTIQGPEPVHVGVLYRPPSGNPIEALEELEKILELCPKKNVHILGDFNINLHDQSNALRG